MLMLSPHAILFTEFMNQTVLLQKLALNNYSALLKREGEVERDMRGGGGGEERVSERIKRTDINKKIKCKMSTIALHKIVINGVFLIP